MQRCDLKLHVVPPAAARRAEGGVDDPRAGCRKCRALTVTPGILEQVEQCVHASRLDCCRPRSRSRTTGWADTHRLRSTWPHRTPCAARSWIRVLLSSFSAMAISMLDFIFGISRCVLLASAVFEATPWNEAPAPTRSGCVPQVRITIGRPCSNPGADLALLSPGLPHRATRRRSSHRSSAWFR